MGKRDDPPGGGARKGPKLSKWLLCLSAGILAVTVAVLLGFSVYLDAVKRPEIILPVLLILGVVALISCLALTATIFSSLNLSTNKQPLGLPQGSIRAVIALVLILIFMMSSVFLYMQVETSGIQVSQRLNQDQIKDIPPEEIAWIRLDDTTTGPNGTPLFNVGRKVVPNEASEDLAQQIVTTVSTLVVAVSAFYFGSKSVEEATRSLKGDGSRRSAPIIGRLEPANPSVKRGTTGIELKIKGRNLESVDKVLLARGAETIDCTDLTTAPTLIRCTVTIPANSDANKYPDGKWAVVLMDSGREVDRLDEAVEVGT